jgi:hypothetical protein
MERKISSAFTEFYKVWGILSVILLVAIHGLPFFETKGILFSLFILLLYIVTLFFAFDFWRMKEVESTDAGLIITDRFFFTQKCTFVPFEQIETVTASFWRLNNSRRISVKFTENTEFGNEIFFVSKGFTQITRAKIVEELNRTVRRSKNAERLKSAFFQ